MKTNFLPTFLLMVMCLFTETILNAQTALCKPLISKSTGSTNCTATIEFEDIDNGSSDYDLYSLSEMTFNGPGTFVITLTVSKNNGSSSTCESTISVIDDVKPIPFVKSQVFVRLDMDNTKTLTPDIFDLGSSDNCTGISHFTITPSEVTCDDISPVQVELRVYDHAGNWDYANVLVNLSNSQNPISAIVCNSEITVILSEGESEEIFTNMVLEGGPYKCWENYNLDILENNIVRPDNFVTFNDIQKNLIVRVTDIISNTPCWANLIVTGENCAVINICDTKSKCSP
jgi:hypothetical protein